jgi:hypothetical protein
MNPLFSHLSKDHTINAQAFTANLNKNYLKKTFLYQVWQHSPRLFFVITTFAALTLLFNIMGNELTPFFVWGMYSQKEEPVKEYEILQTTINNNTVINGYDYYTTDTRFYLYSPLAYYKRIKDNNNTDPVIGFLQSKLHQHYNYIRCLEKKAFNTGLQQQDFFNWYARYLQQVTGQPVKAIRVDVVNVHYTNQNLVVDSVYVFNQWEKP